MLSSTSVRHGEFFQPGHTWFAWALPHMSEGPRHCASLSWPSFRGSHGPVHLATLETLHTALPMLHLWLFFFLLSLPPAPCAVQSAGPAFSLDSGVGGGCGCDGPLSVQDEQSAVSMLKKHQILEQAVEDYAETVHQLSKTSRALVADSHPERCVPLHQMRLGWQFLLVRASCVSLWEAFLKQTQ